MENVILTHVRFVVTSRMLGPGSSTIAIQRWCQTISQSTCRDRISHELVENRGMFSFFFFDENLLLWR